MRTSQIRSARNLILIVLGLGSIASLHAQAIPDAPSRISLGPDDPTLFATPPEDATGSPAKVKKVQLPDFNEDIFYKYKWEFSFETGVLWINIPFIFDVFEHGDYSTNPLHYTLMPLFPTFRWHVSKIDGPSFLRGDTEIGAAIAITPILRGPEKIYGAFDLSFRRNFVYRNKRISPYFEGRLGAGFIDAKERPGINYSGNGYAQGEDYTFTVMTGAGFRYNFSPKYSAALGATYYHISNLYLSEPKWDDNGINVVGPIIGFYMRIGKPKPGAPK